ncbi:MULTISPECIES: oxidoreductase [unclassified Sphingopyxis]|uniref:oxidoreductase n=1 Tax=unclassified Sphingopyxis TaxID=2614943 RepID=UPI000731BC5F|nr:MULTISPECIES: oxidoreductase [unclassified Sphingopyxis]KTE24492.1 oxidoreductase [Sphingopyxis sp. H057]KTE49470.1 oxidoreductase [Sphingopyxis sp. H071]KTE52163.1 oxidoreductase [Sphingopyxis sp. H073]KTE60504.1 oxidoreductase [Sphingopyxis sp. H107]KTE63907.1 oxidoreductase [Sphingopyxis sp. H100]
MRSGFTADDVAQQSGRRFLITGANAGLGFEAAKVLAARGAHVVLACRDAGRAEAAMDLIRDEMPAATLSFQPLDLADLDQVREAAKAVLAGPRIDVLVNNAGVMIPPRTLTKQGYELQFGVNHLGTFAFTGLIHGHVDDRIVVTASIAHKSGTMDYSDLDASRSYHNWPRYQMSKLANLLFMYELDRRLSAAGRATQAIGCHPGVAMTELTRHLPLPLRYMTPLATPFFNSAAQGAWPMLQAATGAHVQGGDYLGPQGLGEISGRSGPARATRDARDPKLARDLWRRSIDLTGVDPGI